MKDWDLTKVFLGILTAISISLGSFALMWVFDANATIKSMQTAKTTEQKAAIETKIAEKANLDFQFQEIRKALETISNDTDDITRMTKQLQKHWKLHTWAKDQVSELRHNQQMPPVSWPDLD